MQKTLIKSILAVAVAGTFARVYLRSVGKF